MFSNRRRALKTLVFWSTALGASRVVKAEGFSFPSAPCNLAGPAFFCDGAPSEPPRDLRTPEQVWQDQLKREVDDILNYENPYHRFVRTVPSYVHRALEARLIELGRLEKVALSVNKGIPYTYGLVVNGNVIVAL